MATYAQLKKQMEQLAKQAEAALRAEKEVVLAKVRDAVSSFALTVDEVFGAGGKKKAKGSKTAGAKRVPTGAGQAKYADPKTGATWSGFGRAPAWIASAKDRTKFLVGQQPAAAPAAPAKAKVAKAAKLAAKRGVSSKTVKASTPAKKVAKAPAAAPAKQATSPVPKASAKKAVKTPSKPKIAMPAKTAAAQPKKSVTKASAPVKKQALPKKAAASAAEAPVAEAPGVVQTVSPAEMPLT